MLLDKRKKVLTLLFAGLGGVAATVTAYQWGRQSARENVSRGRIENQEPPAPKSPNALNEATPHTHGNGPPHVHTAGSEPAHAHDLAPSQAPASTDAQVSAEAARAREVERVRASGPDSRGLLEAAHQVGQSWVAAVKSASLEVSFDGWQCFRAGCMVNARHGAGAFETVTRVVTQSPSFHEWNGEKMRTGPVAASDGTIEATWILYAPRDGEAALGADEAVGRKPFAAPL